MTWKLAPLLFFAVLLAAFAGAAAHADAAALRPAALFPLLAP